MRFRTALLLLIPAIVAAQETTLPIPDALLERLPESWRDVAKRLAPLSQANINTATRGNADEIRYQVVTPLSTKPEGQAFLLTVIETDPSPRIRTRMLTALRNYWANHPEKHDILRRMGTSDPDAKVATEAIEAVRKATSDGLARLVKQRLDLAVKAGNAADVKHLAEQQERWISLRQGVMLPDFMRRVPPLFNVKPANQNIRVLAFGDFGNGTANQRQTAEFMARFNKEKAFDFGITLGDNFYSIGMDSTDDPRWQSQWEKMYGGMGIRFYTTLGNHDWGQSDSPAAELLYSAKSPNWNMPAPYYTYTAGPVQFFALDTNELSDKQLFWLRDEIAKSTARWKVVYGHHHIYSAWRLDNTTLIRQLLPVIRGKVDLYLCGHDHNLQVLKPEQGTHFIVAGAGGAGSYGIKPYERSVFSKSTYGFTILEASQENITVKFIENGVGQIYEHVITK
jgi:tartrate-resistant acid phosphatase type 5